MFDIFQWYYKNLNSKFVMFSNLNLHGTDHWTNFEMYDNMNLVKKGF